MADHPSIQGLKKAVSEALIEVVAALDDDYCTHGQDIPFPCLVCVEAAFQAQAAYLTEHGVGWFGEGLVRADPVFRHARSCDVYGRSTIREETTCTCNARQVVALVPIEEPA